MAKKKGIKKENLFAPLLKTALSSLVVLLEKNASEYLRGLTDLLYLRKRTRQYITSFALFVAGLVVALSGFALFVETQFQWISGLSHLILGAAVMIAAFIYSKYA